MLPAPTKWCLHPPFAATQFLAAASTQRQSWCFSLALRRCQVPGLWDSCAWAAPRPYRALASPKRSHSSTGKSCKKRGRKAPLWKQPSGKQGEGKGQVMSVLQTSWLWNLTASPLFLPSQQNWLQRGWEYFQNRPQSLGGVRATRTKAHHRPWQQRSTQYLSVVKWCLFRVTKKQEACSRMNKGWGKREALQSWRCVPEDNRRCKSHLFHL